MRKKVYGRKLGRNRAARTALFRSLIRAMVLEGSINTTLAKAKAVSPDLDKLMVIVGQNTVSARRRISQIVANDRMVMKKLFSDYLPLAQSRRSGFTRIVLMPKRKGDNATMARIEWVTVPKAEPRKTKKAKVNTKKTKKEVKK